MTLLGKRKGNGRKGVPRKRLASGIFARRPLTRPRNKRPRTTKLGALTTYRYSRWASSGQTHDVSTTSYQGAATFTLDDVKGYTDFSSLYDQFMITHAQIHVTLITNPDAFLTTNGALNAQNQNNWYPKMWYVYDSDDASTLSLDVIRERQGVKYKTLRPNSTIVINIKPRCLVQTYRTATSTGYAPRRMFLDVATGYNVPHYGLKFCIDTMGIDPADKFMVRMETKYWLKFKGVL